MIFAVDYAFVSNKLGASWLRVLDLPRAAKGKIAHRNAERLLGNGPFSKDAAMTRWTGAIAARRLSAGMSKHLLRSPVLSADRGLRRVHGWTARRSPCPTP